MASRSQRRWSLAAILVAVAAIAAHFPRWHHAALGMTTAARSGPRGSSSDLWSAAASHAHRSGLWAGAGLILAILAVACTVAAHFVGERASPTAMIVLLIIYVFMSLMVV